MYLHCRWKVLNPLFFERRSRNQNLQILHDKTPCLTVSAWTVSEEMLNIPSSLLSYSLSPSLSPTLSCPDEECGIDPTASPGAYSHRRWAAGRVSFYVLRNPPLCSPTGIGCHILDPPSPLHAGLSDSFTSRYGPAYCPAAYYIVLEILDAETPGYYGT